MSRLINNMLAGAECPVKAWPTPDNVMPHIWHHGVSETYTRVALTPEGVSVIDAIMASNRPGAAYSIEYATAAQYARAWYQPMGYGGIIDLVPLGGNGVSDEALEHLRAMRPDRRPNDRLLAALADGSASVPIVKLMPSMVLPVAKYDCPLLRAVLRYQARAAQDDGDNERLDTLIAHAATYGIAPGDIGIDDDNKADKANDKANDKAKADKANDKAKASKASKADKA